MAKRGSKKPYGAAVFCDDIRVEIGGKFTLVGVYGTAMLVAGEPPYQIPKFGIYVTYFEAVHGDGSPLTIEIYVPGEAANKPTHSFDLPSPPEEMEPALAFGEEQQIGAQIPIVLAPFQMPAEGTLEVKMRRGDELVSLGRLLVQKMPILSGEQKAFP